MAPFNRPGKDDVVEGEKKKRKSCQGRQLVRWHPGKDQFILLALLDADIELNLNIPWEIVLEKFGVPVTVEAFKQHMVKVRTFRELAGQEVPERVEDAHRRKAPHSDTSTKTKTPDIASDSEEMRAKREAAMKSNLLWFPEKRTTARMQRSQSNVAPSAISKTTKAQDISEAAATKNHTPKRARELSFDEDSDSYEDDPALQTRKTNYSLRNVPAVNYGAQEADSNFVDDDEKAAEGQNTFQIIDETRLIASQFHVTAEAAEEVPAVTKNTVANLAPVSTAPFNPPAGPPGIMPTNHFFDNSQYRPMGFVNNGNPPPSGQAVSNSVPVYDRPNITYFQNPAPLNAYPAFPPNPYLPMGLAQGPGSVIPNHFSGAPSPLGNNQNVFMASQHGFTEIRGGYGQPTFQNPPERFDAESWHGNSGPVGGHGHPQPRYGHGYLPGQNVPGYTPGQIVFRDQHAQSGLGHSSAQSAFARPSAQNASAHPSAQNAFAHSPAQSVGGYPPASKPPAQNALGQQTAHNVQGISGPQDVYQATGSLKEHGVRGTKNEHVFFGAQDQTPITGIQEKDAVSGAHKDHFNAQDFAINLPFSSDGQNDFGNYDLLNLSPAPNEEADDSAFSSNYMYSANTAKMDPLSVPRYVPDVSLSLLKTNNDGQAQDTKETSDQAKDPKKNASDAQVPEENVHQAEHVEQIYQIDAEDTTNSLDSLLGIKPLMPFS